MLYFQSADPGSNPLASLRQANVEQRIVDGHGQVSRTLVSLTRTVTRDRPDIFHSPGFFLPLWPGPKVVTFHDVNMFLQWSNWWRAGRRLSWLSLCAQTVASSRLARKVLADSETTASAVERILHVPENRLTVLYPGIDDRFFCPPDPHEASLLRETHDLQEYLLFVGVLAPQKNLEGVVRAYAAFDRPDLKLAIVGREYGTYFREVILPLIDRLGVPDRVAALGTVSEGSLPGLYAGARALIYPSFGEGFGLPPLEAMACGTPVVASTAPSLPEVLGDAAVLANPFDIRSIVDAIELVLTNGKREALISRGRDRAARFRWSATAAKALEIYASVA